MSNTTTFNNNGEEIILTSPYMSAYVLYGRGTFDGGTGELQFKGVTVENGTFIDGNFEHPIIAGQNSGLTFKITGGGAGVNEELSIYSWVTHI